MRQPVKIHFHINAGKPEAAAQKARLSSAAARLGLVETDDGAAADAVVALGGDGTLLHAVRTFPGVPVLGFKVGGLGYLSSVTAGDFESALAALASGRFRVSERRMLSVDGHDALNDVVLTREMSGHSALLDLEADGKPVTRYLADGLVFATPTGSTAYSLAAGGPVLMPDSRSFVVTPLNPHALAVRPLVVSDGVSFRVTARPRTSGNVVRVGVYADGEHVRMLEAGESLVIAASASAAKLVELDGYDPYDVLARKLGWSGSNLA